VTTPTPTPTVRKLGPGVLTVGSPGAPLDFSGRCTAVAVRWSVDNEDDTPVLSGAVLAGDRTYTATLEATAFQDDLNVGGDVAKKNTADIAWACVGEPELVDDLA
jgi:hypothetical protein